MDLTHLHVHSYYSLLDGLNSPEELLTAAKEHGHEAMAITDHGTLSGHRDMQKSAKKLGMKPILGLEAYISETDRFDRRAKASRKDGTGIYSHIVLLAKNQEGLRNLNRLSEIGWLEGYYHKPRIDLEVLQEHGDGLIVSTACRGGIIAKALENEEPERAEAHAKALHQRFGDDLYIEVMPDNPVEMDSALLDIADRLGIQAIATADCHFARPEDKWIEEAMLIISTSPKGAPAGEFNIPESKKMKDPFERFNYLFPDRRMTFQDLSLFVLDRAGMEKIMKDKGIDRTDIYDNTVGIADKIEEYEFYEKLDLLPRPKTDDPDALLLKKAREGMDELGLSGNEEYEARLAEELDVIQKKGFAAYFVILADIVSWARSKDIMVGPGRGSSAGSLVCYSLGITKIDPIEYGLLFFRFLDVDRDDWPDIDIDFEDRRRGEVKEYLRKHYKNVVAIATIGRYQGKRAIRDAAKAYRIPLDDVNRALKVDLPPNKFFSVWPTTPQGIEFNQKHPEVMQLAEYFHGRVRERGVHPGGTVISSEPVSDYTPIESAIEPKDVTQTRIPMISYDMEEAAEIGLQKIDLLGLKTLSVLVDTLGAIEDRHGKKIDLLELSLTDHSVYDTIVAGHTKGIFQAEQPAFTKMAKAMKISNFEELAVANALVRPGAANTIGPEYIARKEGRTPVSYMHEVLKEFTSETFGVIVYQEQVMLACVHLGGMTMAEANKVRKIIGKKRDVKEFEQFREKFIQGASKHITPEAASHLWHDFEAHADYSFNKSHAVAYAFLSYWTAWLKKHYPTEFMWALLRNETDKKTLTRYLIEAKRLGITILLPNVEKSDLNFSLEGDSIRFGLQQIKNISAKNGPKLMAGRPFDSHEALTEYITKTTGLNKPVITSLDAIGAATYDDHPRTGNEPDNYYEYLGIPKFRNDMIPVEILEQTTPCEDFNETDVFFVLGIVTKITRKNNWVRVEILDETGEIGVFHPDSDLEVGNMYLLLIGVNRIQRAIAVDDIRNDNHDPMLEFLRKDKLNIGDGKLVLSFNAQRAKSGNNFAHVIVSNNKKELRRVLVFNRQFPTALTKMKRGAVVDLILAKTEDDDLFVKGIR